MAYSKNSFNPGNLIHRIIFKAKPTARDTDGMPTEDWTVYKTVSASITPISGRSFWQGQANQSEISHEIKMRYIPGIVPSMRIYFGTRKFEITHILNFEERNIWLTVYCKELFIDA
jgi:SPP1 family predicted phage head-tail adaptor